MSIDIKRLLREPSTKRGIVMLFTGGTVLYLAVFGDGAIDITSIELRIERWLGIGLMIVGFFGLLPDSPRDSKEPDREARMDSAQSDRCAAIHGVRLDVPPDPDPPSKLDERGNAQEGYGFNDR